MQAAKLRLYDIQLRSLKGADQGLFAAELVRFKVVQSLEAAEELSAKPPCTLARYVGPRAAEGICRFVRGTGAEVWLSVSSVICPHCGFSVQCEGEPNAQQDGIVFCCRACQGLTLLSTTDSRFHAVLRCEACRSLVDVTPEGPAGQYPCSCGKILPYAPPKRVVPVTVEKAPFPLKACIAVLCLMVLAALTVRTWLFVVRGPEADVAAFAESGSPPAKPTLPASYGELHAGTDRAGVISVLGAPERESKSEDGEEIILFYRRYDCYVVLRKRGADYSYASTIRISDETILHRGTAR